MIVFKFIWYCIQCMFSCFTAIFGYVPDNFTIKEILIGVATFVVIAIIIFLILWLIRVIKFKK